MKLTPLDDIFHVEYGNQYDLNKMEQCDEGVNFVSRSSNNLGVVAKVERTNEDPYECGLITVTLGGTYLLSSFVQQNEFYTAQNIKVLTPLFDMSLNEKIYYCICISKNRFRYSSHGREANKSLNTLLVPDLEELPEWINKYDVGQIIKKEKILDDAPNLFDRKWDWIEYKKIFDIERGKGARKTDISEYGKTPFITSIEKNNGLTGYVDKEPTHIGNVITVNRNGSIGEAFYQKYPFCSTEDVHILKPKFELNPYIGFFLAIVTILNNATFCV